MVFQWQFNLGGVDLKNAWSDDVVKMVQSKLECLHPKVKRTLIIAAYLRHIIDFTTLLESLKAVYGYDQMDGDELKNILDQAVSDGLLLKISADYRFSHDRVQEAAYTLIPQGEERDRLLVHIAGVLLSLAASNHSLRSEDDWVIFVAAEYFSSVPKSLIRSDTLQLVKLYLRVANLCLGKASFDKAVDMLRAGVSFLTEMNNIWEEHYDLSLSLFNQLMEAEFALGNYEETKAAFEAVVSNAKCAKDMCTAFHTKVAMTVQINNRNHALGVVESAKLLNKCGVNIPLHITNRDIMSERIRLKLALGTRPITVLADMPIMEDPWVMKLIFQLCHLLSITRNNTLNTFVTLRAMRLSLENGISKYLPQIIVNYSVPLKINGEFNTCYSYATVVRKLYDRFPEERGGDYATSQMMLHSGILPLKEPFKDSMDAHFSSYRIALAAGNTDCLSFSDAFSDAVLRKWISIECLSRAQTGFVRRQSYTAQSRRFRCDLPVLPSIPLQSSGAFEQSNGVEGHGDGRRRSIGSIGGELQEDDYSGFQYFSTRALLHLWRRGNDGIDDGAFGTIPIL
jgi:predicted ATPase